MKLNNIYTFFIISFFFINCAANLSSNTTNSFNQKSNKYNVKDFGAKGDGIKDDSFAIQKCFNYINSIGGGVAFFPKGTYIISRTEQNGKAWCLFATNNLKIEGENKDSTIIKLASKQRNYTRMLYVEEVNNVKIENITFDGSRILQNNPTKPSEHLGGVYINSSSNVIIKKSNFINTGGDGIGIRGPNLPSKNIVVDSCFFDGNFRSGVALGSGFDTVKITNNFFGKNIDDSSIDTEPSSGICENVLIENNIIKTKSLVTIGGPKINNTGKKFIIRNNKLSSSLFLVRAQNVIIENNEITLENPKRPAITCLGKNDSIYIKNNTISVKNKDAIQLTQARGENNRPENIFITNNTIALKGEKVKLINSRGVKNVVINDNTFKGDNNIGVYFFSNYKINEITVNNNFFSNFKTSIKLQPLKNKISNVNIIDNKITSVNNSEKSIDIEYAGSKNNLIENIYIKSNKLNGKVYSNVTKRKDQLIKSN
ncbi:MULTISPECIES: glycosyl hydrolase family 28-related protein [Tenacibaculum]|uniref:glycosyl hydrolase family 28-related protein n=1 Tax=Tenacibaculum TaxID=104267 RepID=UPI001F0B4F13|nr:MULTISPECIES: glycosyl hydrolase family 28-related protein [Tenacibaculum]MCH3883138.1 glycoside hydrolase family 55 protein [Tenacibaculum aquimarinum]MDO6600876.1 glycosyl hydrolase family 28-related protein [Tenacibaculum sp. 1_MG-2023]